MQQKQFSVLKFVIITGLILSIGCKKNNNTIQSPIPPAGFVFIPAPGEKDSIGSVETETGNPNEKPRHRIQLSPFFMAKYELTIKEFNTFIQASYKDTSTGYAEYNNQGDNFPVIWVGWIDAIKYCNWRSKTENLDTCYIFKPNGIDIDSYNFGQPGNSKNGYRLPTEAEWEYACRAHSDSAYTIGNTGKNTITTANANFNNTGTVPVDSYKPNGFGLYNMHGNVWEWCSDKYDQNYYTNPNAIELNPVNSKASLYHVVRGGGWNSSEASLRSAYRNGYWPIFNFVGFRIAKTM